MMVASLGVILPGCAAQSMGASSSPENASGNVEACTIAYVIDGDTVECEEGNERIRLLLIDAPEMSQSDYGERATIALEAMLPVGSVARLELDVEERDVTAARWHTCTRQTARW